MIEVSLSLSLSVALSLSSLLFSSSSTTTMTMSKYDEGVATSLPIQGSSPIYDDDTLVPIAAMTNCGLY